MSYVSLDKCKGMTLLQLIEQVGYRKILQQQMAGSLYPSILESEIETIRQMIFDQNTFNKHHQTTSDAYDRAMSIL